MNVMLSQVTGHSTVCLAHQRTIKVRITGPLWGEFTGDRWNFPQKASNAEKASIWWRHHVNRIMIQTLSRSYLMYSSKLCIIGSDNGLLLILHQIIVWTTTRSLLVGHLGRHLSEIVIRKKYGRKSKQNYVLHIYCQSQRQPIKYRRMF